MIYNLVSCNVILNKIFRDLGFTIAQETDYLTDMVEWIGEGLEAIGSAELEMCTHKGTVKDNRVCLPGNLFYLEMVTYQGKMLPSSSQTYEYGNKAFDDKLEVNGLYSFFISGGWLKTNVPEGEEIFFHYKGFPVDENGYPKIPDVYTFKEALFWYILYKMMMRGFEHPNKQITFQTANSQWLKYCSQAEAESKLMDLPRMNTFKNKWVRLIPNIQPLENFNVDNNPEDIIYPRNNFIW